MKTHPAPAKRSARPLVDANLDDENDVTPTERGRSLRAATDANIVGEIMVVGVGMIRPVVFFGFGSAAAAVAFFVSYRQAFVFPPPCSKI
jgi:hypothetical protein